MLNIYRQFRQRRKHKIVRVLEQLIREILDTAVLLADYQRMRVRCSLWVEDGVGNLHCLTTSSNMRYDSDAKVLFPLSQEGCLENSYREKTQYFECPTVTASRPLSPASNVISVVSTDWQWRLTTPIFDAIDRVLVLGVLCLDGKDPKTVQDIDKAGIDKMSTMIASQLCSVLSTMRRL